MKEFGSVWEVVTACPGRPVRSSSLHSLARESLDPSHISAFSQSDTCLSSVSVSAHTHVPVSPEAQVQGRQSYNFHWEKVRDYWSGWRRDRWGSTPVEGPVTCCCITGLHSLVTGTLSSEMQVKGERVMRLCPVNDHKSVARSLHQCHEINHMTEELENKDGEGWAHCELINQATGGPKRM